MERLYKLLVHLERQRELLIQATQTNREFIDQMQKVHASLKDLISQFQLVEKPRRGQSRRQVKAAERTAISNIGTLADEFSRFRDPISQEFDDFAEADRQNKCGIMSCLLSPNKKGNFQPISVAVWNEIHHVVE